MARQLAHALDVRAWALARRAGYGPPVTSVTEIEYRHVEYDAEKLEQLKL